MIHTEFNLRYRALFSEDDWDIYDLKDGERYRFTKDELGWLDFIRSSYRIADHFMDNMVDDIYTMDRSGLNEALWLDGTKYRPACLNEKTALAFIVWYTADMSMIDELSQHISTDYGY